MVGAKTNYDEKSRTVSVNHSSYFNHLSFVLHDFQWVQQESIFWHRELYERVGGVRTDYKLAGDFDLWMRISRHEKMFIIDALIGGFRHSESQLSKNLELYFDEVDDIIAKETVSPEEQKRIKMLERNKRVISLKKKINILNWHPMNSRMTAWLAEEERHQRIYFDFDRKQFVLPN